MRACYDFHIHSALSPCGDDDMTPNNIVNMAAVCGMDVIAITDHNSVDNCEAAMRVAKSAGITVIPGMELETSEEVHVIMLFPDLASAKACSVRVRESMLKIANRVDIYGNQFVMNERDEIIGSEQNLLIVSTGIGVYDAAELAREFGGVAYPAHIDKPAHGILEILGDIDDMMGFTCVEVSPHASEEFVRAWEERGYIVIRSSDAHYLDALCEKEENFLELDAFTAAEAVKQLARR